MYETTIRNDDVPLLKALNVPFSVIRGSQIAEHSEIQTESKEALKERLYVAYKRIEFIQKLTA